MSGDRQDFLERQEARRQRRQQRPDPKASTGRVPRPADSSEATKRRAEDQASAAAGGKPGIARPAGRVPGASAPQPEERTGGAARTGAARKAESLDARKGQAAARTPGDLEERPLAGGLAGRHTAARREEMAGLATLPPEPKPRLLARLIIWGTGAICGLLILATIGEAWTVHRLNQQIAANQQVVNQLQAQNQAISSSIQQLQQASTIEQEARKLGFIFPGDQPVTIVMAPPPPAPPKPAAPPAQSWWGFWSDWLKLFFGG